MTTGRLGHHGREVDLLATPPEAVPAQLAELHRDMAVGSYASVLVLAPTADDDMADAAAPAWPRQRLLDVIEGAGFGVDSDAIPPTGSPDQLQLSLRRLHTLPDTVGVDMRLLVCGLNPSLYAADTGVGFGRPGNRFWPAALAVDLVSTDRDPARALERERVGMTDMVKRATRAASELAPEEYRHGLARVERLIEWLAPTVVCFVGLAGWRLAHDRTATAGSQPQPLGGRPVYLMPSTSGLNAHTSPADFERHLRAALELGS